MNTSKEIDLKRHSSRAASSSATRQPRRQKDLCGLIVGNDASQQVASLVREEFWFDNGDLVLEVEQHRFKIHRAGLSCSEVFVDMFALPGQPPDEECVDGVPLVQLVDNAYDWMTLLSWVYEYDVFVRRTQEFNFAILAGALRIAAKYEITELRDWTSGRISEVWPENLSKMTAAAIPHAADLIRLSRVVDLPVLSRMVPTAFYALSISHIYDEQNAACISRALDPAEIQRLHTGAGALHALTHQLILDPLGPVLTALEAPGGAPRSVNPWNFCSPHRSCVIALASLWCARLAQPRAADKEGALPGGPGFFSLAHELIHVTACFIAEVSCERCRTANEFLAWERLHELQRRLPNLFDL